MNNDAARGDFEHQIAREWIYRRLDNHLSGEHRLHLDQHLEHCAECRAFDAQVRLLDRRLRAEMPLIGVTRQVQGPVTALQGKWLGQQWQQRLQAQARQRRLGFAVLLLAGLIALVVYFAQPENRTPASAAPSFAQLNSTQTAIAAWPTATPLATQTLRATALPRPQGRLLYEASDNRSTDLYFTHADASGRMLLAPASSSDRAPHPSPDRSQVAFISNRLNIRQFEIYLTDVEGSSTRMLSDMGRESPGWTGEMAWSPDSSQLVAVLDHPDRAVPFQVVRGDPVDDSRHYDGQWEGQLYHIDTSTGLAAPLTPPDLLVWNPAWSPDGKQIYFNALIEGYTRLYSIRPDGSGLQSVGDAVGTTEQAGFSFSPDGKSLAYLSLRRTRGTNQPDELHVLDLASGRTRVLLDIPNRAEIDLSLAARFGMVRWSPDGARLAYAIPDADGQATLRMVDVLPDPKLPGVLRAGNETVLYVGIDLYFPGHVPAWSLDSRSLGILLSRRVYVISAHSDADSAGGADLMEVYAGTRDEIGAGWLSWFP